MAMALRAASTGTSTRGFKAPAAGAEAYGRAARLRRRRPGPYASCTKLRDAPSKARTRLPVAKKSASAQSQLCAAPTRPPASAAVTLTDLADGPYLVLAHWLDAASLCSADAACRRLQTQNNSHIGPWCAMGVRDFRGLELQEHGLFAEAGGARAAQWKARYHQFKTQLPTFCPPFGGREIQTVKEPDEVAYFQCHLRPDALDPNEGSGCGGVYLEVEIRQNSDNLSIALVDFEAGGCSSVTFSPDTGAVIRERKVQELPRRVQGEFVQPLQALTPGERFHGLVGLQLLAGRLAFFRRSVPMAGGGGAAGGEAAPKPGPWETTGFVTDLSWAAGRRLTPCLAFRSKGDYQVRLVSIGGQPPKLREAPARKELKWSSLDWEAEPEEDVAVA
jgi:hypothetical protein